MTKCVNPSRGPIRELVILAFNIFQEVVCQLPDYALSLFGLTVSTIFDLYVEWLKCATPQPSIFSSRYGAIIPVS